MCKALELKKHPNAPRRDDYILILIAENRKGTTKLFSNPTRFIAVLLIRGLTCPPVYAQQSQHQCTHWAVWWAETNGAVRCRAKRSDRCM